MMVEVWTMKAALLVFYIAVVGVDSYQFYNETAEPAVRQLYDFKLKHPKPVGLFTTSSGFPVEIRDTMQLNSDQFTSQYHLDLHTSFDGEKIPERVVHAKGSSAFGYFVVTNDVSGYTNADVFNGIGKKVPLVARFSSALANLGGTDLLTEQKGIAFKFYTDEGNLDLMCIQIPIFFFRQPTGFAYFMHAFRKNPRTYLFDNTYRWDAVTMLPELINAFLWMQSDYGRPDGYRKLDAFPVHTYELTNKKGERHYVKFNFRTEQGLANLTNDEVAIIQGKDLDYSSRDLYNAIERKEYPSWRLEMDIMTLEGIKHLDFNPFDVTVLWKRGTYKTVNIGRVVLNRNPDNIFATTELSAFNPANLVPGIPGPVDTLFKARRLIYRDTQDHRLGTNHNKIPVNMPKYANTYVRDGTPPVRDNMMDAPTYYPNSFNGPAPYVDETKPEETLVVYERNAVDFEQGTHFYNKVLESEGERQRLVEDLVISLIGVPPKIQKRGLRFMHFIDKDLGKRVTSALNIAQHSASG